MRKMFVLIGLALLGSSTEACAQFVDPYLHPQWQAAQSMAGQIARSQQMNGGWDYTYRSPMSRMASERVRRENMQRLWYRSPTGDVVRRDMVPYGAMGRYRSLGPDPSLLNIPSRYRPR